MMQTWIFAFLLVSLPAFGSADEKGWDWGGFVANCASFFQLGADSSEGHMGVDGECPVPCDSESMDTSLQEESSGHSSLLLSACQAAVRDQSFQELHACFDAGEALPDEVFLDEHGHAMTPLTFAVSRESLGLFAELLDLGARPDGMAPFDRKSSYPVLFFANWEFGESGWMTRPARDTAIEPLSDIRKGMIKLLAIYGAKVPQYEDRVFRKLNLNAELFSFFARFGRPLDTWPENPVDRRMSVFGVFLDANSRITPAKLKQILFEAKLSDPEGPNDLGERNRIFRWFLRILGPQPFAHFISFLEAENLGTPICLGYLGARSPMEKLVASFPLLYLRRMANRGHLVPAVVEKLAESLTKKRLAQWAALCAPIFHYTIGNEPCYGDGFLFISGIVEGYESSAETWPPKALEADMTNHFLSVLRGQKKSGLSRLQRK